MNLVILAAFVAVAGAAKLDRTYLPPASAKTAGGHAGDLKTPFAGNSFNNGLGGLPKGSYTNDAQGVVVDAAAPGTRASEAADTGLGAPRISYGSTNSKVGAAAFQGPAGFRQGPGFDGQADETESQGFPSQFNQGSQFNSQDSSFNSPSFNPQGSQFNQGSSFNSQGSSFNPQGSFHQAQEGPERAKAALDRAANTLRFDSEVGPESFSYAFETDNGITAEESAVATNGVQAQGGFSYTGDDGQVYSVTYTADEGGYQPKGDHLPTPPPIPEEILRSLEQNARDEAAGLVDDGSYDAQKYNAGSDYAESDNSNDKYNHQSSKFGNRGEEDATASGTFINQNSQAFARTGLSSSGHSSNDATANGFGHSAEAALAPSDNLNKPSNGQSTFAEASFSQSGNSNRFGQPQGSLQNKFGSNNAFGNQKPSAQTGNGQAGNTDFDSDSDSSSNNQNGQTNNRFGASNNKGQNGQNAFDNNNQYLPPTNSFGQQKPQNSKPQGFSQQFNVNKGADDQESNTNNESETVQPLSQQKLQGQPQPSTFGNVNSASRRPNGNGQGSLNNAGSAQIQPSRRPSNGPNNFAQSGSEDEFAPSGRPSANGQKGPSFNNVGSAQAQPSRRPSNRPNNFAQSGSESDFAPFGSPSSNGQKEPSNGGSAQTHSSGRPSNAPNNFGQSGSNHLSGSAFASSGKPSVNGQSGSSFNNGASPQTPGRPSNKPNNFGQSGGNAFGSNEYLPPKNTFNQNRRPSQSGQQESNASPNAQFNHEQSEDAQTSANFNSPSQFRPQGSLSASSFASVSKPQSSFSQSQQQNGFNRPQSNGNRFNGQSQVTSGSSSFAPQKGTTQPDTELTTPFEDSNPQNNAAGSSRPTPSSFSSNSQFPSSRPSQSQSGFGFSSANVAPTSASASASFGSQGAVKPQRPSARPQSSFGQRSSAFPSQPTDQHEESQFGGNQPEPSHFSKDNDAHFAASTQRPSYQQSQGSDDSYYYKQPAKPFRTPQESRFPNAPSQSNNVNQRPNSAVGDRFSSAPQSTGSPSFPSQNKQPQSSSRFSQLSSLAPASPTNAYQGQSNGFAGITQASISPFPSEQPTQSTQFNQQSQFGSRPTQKSSNRSGQTQFGKPSFGQSSTPQNSFQKPSSTKPSFQSQGFEQQSLNQGDDEASQSTPSQQYDGEIYEYNKPAQSLPAPENDDAEESASNSAQFGQKQQQQPFGQNKDDNSQSPSSHSGQSQNNRPQFGSQTQSSPQFGQQSQNAFRPSAQPSRPFGSSNNFEPNSESESPEPTQGSQSQFGSNAGRPSKPCCQNQSPSGSQFGRPSQNQFSQQNTGFNTNQGPSTSSFAGKGEQFGGPRKPPSFDQETGYHY